LKEATKENNGSTHDEIKEPDDNMRRRCHMRCLQTGKSFQASAKAAPNIMGTGNLISDKDSATPQHLV
jgi:hypothetical protein